MWSMWTKVKQNFQKHMDTKQLYKYEKYFEFWSTLFETHEKEP